MKCLMPVKTMAMSCSSAASITSLSRMEPPGWMIALIPLSAAVSIESLKGKKASEAITQPAICTPKEFQLLEFLMLNAERVVRRTELLEKVWDLHFDPMSNVVDVHVGHLRRKLRESGDDPLVHTVRGVGYIFQKGESK